MQLLYPSFLHVPALQQVVLYTEAGSALLCSVPGLVSMVWWSQLKVTGKDVCGALLSGAHTHGATSAFSG